MAKDIFCPYCQKTVRAGKIRWLWLGIFILIGWWPIYLIYCLFTRSHICPECKKRIYQERK